MLAADTTFEARLIDRLALNEAGRRWLSPARRRILRLRGEGWTLKEIAERETLSVERIRQQEFAAYRVLSKPQAGLGRRLWVPPVVNIVTRQVGFDKAAFLDHMRFLIARKAHAEVEELERETVFLGCMLDQEVRAEQEARRLAEEAQARLRRAQEMARLERELAVERQERERNNRLMAENDEKVRTQREQEDARWGAELQGLMEEMRLHEGEMTAQQQQKYQWLALLRQTYGIEMAARYVGFPTIAAALKAGGNAS